MNLRKLRLIAQVSHQKERDLVCLYEYQYDNGVKEYTAANGGGH